MTSLELKGAEADAGRCAPESSDRQAHPRAVRHNVLPGSHNAFCSILFESPKDRSDEALEAPAFFADLNCDQVVEAITARKDEYNLKPFFYSSLHRVDAINYRQEVMRDLENHALFDKVDGFAQGMRRMREHLLAFQRLYYKQQKQAWFLDAVNIYCDSVAGLATHLSSTRLRSRGFLRFRDYVVRYVNSPRFTSLVSEVKAVKAALWAVRYSILIKDNSFTVSGYQSEIDFSADVEETFKKFREGAAEDYRVKFSTSHNMNHVEAKILEFVARLHPDVFAALSAFCVGNQDYLDRAVATFDRELQFYVAYLEYIGILKRAGLRFCYPRVSDADKSVHDHNGFDIALAHKLVAEKRPVVCNDFELNGPERILVVSGPNQGGKTTFARCFGQVHYLASIGCPVPGTTAQLLHFDRLFTQFEREEKVETLRGKLEDDLFRISDILDQATPRSIIVMNEIFTSTTLQDEIFLSRKVMQRIIDHDALCVWVTFIDELASFGPQTVSMVSTVAPENPALRTFKILRRPADGLAYAMAIAQKYRLTEDAIKRRVPS